MRTFSIEPIPRVLCIDLTVQSKTVEVSYSPEAEAFRAEVREFLGRHIPPGWQGMGALANDEAETFSLTWRRKLYENGLLGLTWPKEYGGAGRSKVDQVVLAEELSRARVPMGRVADTTSVKMMGNTLLRWGTEEQKRRLLPRILSGEDVWVQGYSEPDAGSDLGSVSLRAERHGDEWVINGQKIWTSRGSEGTHIFLLARTDPTAPKHRGLSFLLCRTDAPGVEVRPIRVLTGQAEFCEVFFTDTRAAAADVVGPVNGGWAVAMSLLGHERGEEAAVNPILFRAEYERLVTLAREAGRERDPVIRDRLAQCYAQVEVMRFLGYRILTDYLRTDALGPEASVSKLYWSEYHQRAADLAMELLGGRALVREGRRPFRHFRTDEPGAPNTTNSWIDVCLLNARSGTVYAGTSQIQRNIIGEAILGLPKEPAAAGSGRNG
jgi:alkylation response protein AidB-like acyl-CoA dehydrogenase